MKNIINSNKGTISLYFSLFSWLSFHLITFIYLIITIPCLSQFTLIFQIQIHDKTQNFFNCDKQHFHSFLLFHSPLRFINFSLSFATLETKEIFSCASSSLSLSYHNISTCVTRLHVNFICKIICHIVCSLTYIYIYDIYDHMPSGDSYAFIVTQVLAQAHRVRVDCVEC